MENQTPERNLDLSLVGTKEGDLNTESIYKMLVDPHISVVFDFDNTLFDTDSFHKNAVINVAESLLEREIILTPELINQELKGHSGRVIFEIIFRKFAGVEDTSLVVRAVELRRVEINRLAEGVFDAT